MNSVVSSWPTLSDGEFGKISNLLQRATGVGLPTHKKSLISDQLVIRIGELHMANFGEYIDYIDEYMPEMMYAAYLLTRHETFFFRYPRHYDFLAEVVVPAHAGRPLDIWSAATSTGEEAYSIAMTLMHASAADAAWNVLGTDINPATLAKADMAIYDGSRLGNLPSWASRRYFEHDEERDEALDGGMVRIAPFLRERVQFRPANLAANTVALGRFDAIFLCNVLFYLDISLRRQVVYQICSQLRPGGWLFVGPAEGYIVLCDELAQEEPTIFRRVSKQH